MIYIDIKIKQDTATLTIIGHANTQAECCARVTGAFEMFLYTFNPSEYRQENGYSFLSLQLTIENYIIALRGLKYFEKLKELYPSQIQLKKEIIENGKHNKTS